MTATAEEAQEALAAFARDLVEEISAGRALELAEAGQETLELAFVRPFQRTERVRGRVVQEQVRGHAENHLGGGQLAHPGNLAQGGLQHPTGWIPQPDWQKGERDWIAKGEAAWNKNKWKAHGKPKTSDQLQDEMQATEENFPGHRGWIKSKANGGPAERPEWAPVEEHLSNAQGSMQRRGLGFQKGQIDQDETAKAYHELTEAHRHITQNILPNARPEEYPEIAEHLQRISGHMKDLDRAMGANPDLTEKNLGSFQDIFQHAGHARREAEAAKQAEQAQQAAAEESRRADLARQGIFSEEDAVPNWLAPGRRVTDPRFHTRIEGIVTGVRPEYGGRLDIRWDDGNEGSYGLSSAKELLQPAKGEEKTPGFFARPQAAAQSGMESAMSRAQSEAMVGKRVIVAQGAGYRLSEGRSGVVVAVPDQIFDMGAEEMVPNDQNWVEVQWDGENYQQAVPPEALQLAGKTGAAAVHPQLGGHLAQLPGDTISGHAHANAPRPFPVQAPDQRDVAVQAAQQALAMRDAQDQMQLQDAHAAAIADRTGIPAPGTYAPLTDEQYAAHVATAEHLIAAEVAAGHTTDKTQTIDGNGQVWKPERAALHNDIVRRFLQKATPVPSERKGLIMGGLGGSGKTTTLHEIPELDVGRYAVVNADDIKEEMGRRGMIPQVEGLSPMESVALVHAESNHVANLLAQELLARGKNTAFDMTMSSKGVTQERLDWYKANGYKDVQAVFVHVPVETSIERTRSRYRAGLEEYRQGQGLGGRLVPENVLRGLETPDGSTVNRQVFDSLRGKFSSWQLWDNSGDKPKLVEKSAPPQGTGIASVEDLERQAREYTRYRIGPGSPESTRDFQSAALGPGAEFMNSPVQRDMWGFPMGAEAKASFGKPVPPGVAARVPLNTETAARAAEVGTS